jgi:hypothetical protein
MSDRTYPLPRPADGEDPRFNVGLLADVEEVLVAAGYPPLTGMDHVVLQSVLFRFLYAPLDPSEDPR